jgi:hypothetical protein
MNTRIMGQTPRAKRLLSTSIWMMSLLLIVGLLAAACGSDATATPTQPAATATPTATLAPGVPTPTPAPATPTPVATPTPSFDAAGYFSDKRIRILVSNSPGGGTDREARYLARAWGDFFPGNPGFIVTNFGGPIPAANLLAKSKTNGLTMLVSSQALLDFEPLEVSNFKVADFESIGAHVVPGNSYGVRGDLPYNNFEEARGSDVPLLFGSAAQTPGGVGAAETRLMILAEAFDFPLRLLPISGATSTNVIMVPFERGEVNTLSAAWWRMGPLRPDWFADEFLVPFAYYGSSAFEAAPEFPAPDPASQLTGELQIAWKALQALTAFHKYLWLPPETPAALVEAHQKAWAAATADPVFMEGFRQAIGFADVRPTSGPDFHEIMKQSSIDYNAGAATVEKIATELGPKYFN